MHPSIANLSSRLHLCTGDIPPPLVGASATLVEPSQHVTGTEASLYLFGGRLVSSRRMINSLYRLDLGQMRWSKLTPPTKQRSGLVDAPQPHPRYFHSADLWRDKIVFFGGMGYSVPIAESASSTSIDPSPDELCVLNEILVFDLGQQAWIHDFDTSNDIAQTTPDFSKPPPRYAHLSSLAGDILTIIGGQNLANQYVESINLFHLEKQAWVGSHKFPKQCGSYRSLSVGTQYSYKQGEKAKCYPRGRDPLNDDTRGPSSLRPTPSTRVEQNPLPMSVAPKANEPVPVYVYSNYNFTDVRRELEVLTVQPDASARRSRSASDASQDSAVDADMHISPAEQNRASLSSEDRSKDMGGVTLPPGLRFPTGAVLGPYLLIAGTYLANATQTFSIWALHLPSMVWSRIEAGSALSTGSWNRAILWPKKNRLIVVGHKERDLVSDYNQRQTNWDHVVVLELEAWGVYQPPISILSEPAVQIGLDKLADSAPSALVPSVATRSEANGRISSSESLGGRGDFEIVCSDGLRIGCDRVILECRWPWFRSKMDEFRKRARKTFRHAFPTAAADQFGLGMIPENISDIFEADADDDDETIDPLMTLSRTAPATGKQGLKDPRFQPRHLQISEPSPVVLAFLQFLYSSRISTALQRHPAVVCALMVLAKTYDMEDLAAWARHAAHVALADDLTPKPTAANSRVNVITDSSSMMNEGLSSSGHLFKPAESLGLHPEERHRLAVCLYEAASLCGCEGLQIRALRVVMAIARWLQKHGNHSPGTSGPGPGTEPADKGEEDRNTSRNSTAPTYSQQHSGHNPQSGGYHSAPTHRGSGGQSQRSHAKFLPTRVPSPVLTMSRSGSDAASSQGPVTPTSIHQSFLDRRNSSLSSTDGSHRVGEDSNDNDDLAISRWSSHPRGSSLKNADKALSLASYLPINNIHQPELAPSIAGEYDVTADTAYSMATSHGSGQDLPLLSGTQLRLDSFRSREAQSSSSSYEQRSLPLSPRSSVDASQKVSHMSGIDGEQYRVNAYGPRPGPMSRSASVPSSSLAESNRASAQDLRMPASQTVALSDKDAAKRDKERKKQQLKEEKLRKKAEKAEYKRLAADAVFGPKGSTAPCAHSVSDFAALTLHSRRDSEMSDTRSGSGRSGSRASSFSTTSRSLVGSAPVLKAGEWSVTTASTASPWFSAPPPPMPRQMPRRSESLS